jgi:two-component system, NarL family, response regulator NreC
MVAHIRLAREPAAERAELSAPAPITVLVAAQHPMMQHGLCQLLECEQDIEVLSAVTDGAKSLLDEAGRGRPDVVVLDRNASDGSRIATIAQLRERAPKTQVVVLTADDPPTFVQRALTAGALGLVEKDAADQELAPAIRAAARGKRYVSPRVASSLATLQRTRTHERLTPRETEVLELIALGHTNVEIAHKLALSPRTIETHRAHIHSKLALQTRADLVRYALRHGLLGVSDPGS